MDERLRKELLRSELKERNKGKKIIRCKYRPKYPDSAEREYVRLINAYMTIEKEVLMKYIPEIKQILNDGTQLHTDSKKDNEKKRRTARFSALDNTIVRLTILFKAIANEKDYRKAVEIIKAGGYATDINYVSKICSIIKKYELTQYDEMEELNMGIEIRKQIATNSPCNKTGDEITVKGSMLHSVGCPQPKPEVFAKIWETSTGACVHAVTGADAYAIQCLPLFPERKKARRGWHGASGKNGSVNNTHLSLEMTEPATIKYVGGATWIETGDGSNTKRHVLATYANAVQVFAKWCKEFGLNPLEDGVIISHHEGNQRGIASNHGDVEHIWNKFGLTMDQFREDVKKAMGGQTINTVPDAPVDNSSDDTSSQAVNPLSGSVKIIYTGDDGLNVRKAPCILDKYVDHVEHAGTFTVVGISADEKWYKLKSGLFITTIPEYVSFKATPEQKQQTAGTGYYRVRKSWDDAGSQIGAFKNACIESFHSIIKREWLNRFKIHDYKQAYRLIFEYLEAFYNTKRIHSHCNYMSPNEFERLYERTHTEAELLAG